jgi:multidrug resistance efflux pump
MSAKNPIRKWTVIVLVICAVLFVYHLISDRITPYTSQAFVQTFLVGIAPEVSGNVIEVDVEDNQRVEQGQVLFKIDSSRFKLALEAAQAKLAEAGQNIGASTAQVAAAEAQLTEAKADRLNVGEQSDRIFELVRKGIYAQARGDQAQAELESAEAAVSRAEADLEEAQQRLGPEGNMNPQIRSAIAEAEQARLDLIRSTLTAPSDGLVTNLQLTVGQYANAGQPVMTFVDIRSVWILALYRENNLGNIKAGDRVEVVLDVRPGRVFPARVESVGWGVSQDEIASSSQGLPTIRLETGWMREAQRFPLRIEFDGTEFPKGIRVGSQANTIVYTGDNPILNALGWLWIRLVSLLSYVY